MRRLLPWMLLLTLILSSCGIITVHPPGGETDAAESTKEAETTGEETLPTYTGTLPEGVSLYEAPDYAAAAKAALDALPVRDMKDVPFLILTADETPYAPGFYEAEEEGALVSQAYLERCALLEGKYGVSLVTATLPEASFYDTVQEKLTAGEYLCDLIELPCDLLGEFAARTISVNMNALPFTDYSKDYFNHDAIAQCSAGYTIYGVVGNANLYPEKTECFFVNSSLFPSLSKEVYRGNWTWDKFYELQKTCPEGVAFLKKHGTFDLTRTVLASTNTHLFDTAYGTLPEARDPGAVEAAVSRIQSFTAIIDDTTEGLNAFRSGKCALLLGHVGDMREMDALSFDWTILPLPKKDAAQTGYFARAEGMTVFTAISTMASSEVTGLILQALNASATPALAEAWANEALRFYVRTSDTANMIPRVAGTLSYDFCYMMQSSYNSVRIASVEPFEAAIRGEKTFTEGYRKHEENLIDWNPKNFVWH